MPDSMSAAQPEYEVVRNSEGQYSIFPRGRDVPAGWKKVGWSGPEEECLRYIEGVWHDITPDAVRKG
jgi:MbtH protein